MKVQADVCSRNEHRTQSTECRPQPPQLLARRDLLFDSSSWPDVYFPPSLETETSESIVKMFAFAEVVISFLQRIQNSSPDGKARAKQNVYRSY